MDGNDLSQYLGVFFDEAAEHLAAMESLLLELDVGAADAEKLAAIFRAAHSVKGGAAMFGMQDIAELTHEMETVFDRVRRGEQALTREIVDTFLACADALKAMLAARRKGESGAAEADVGALCGRLRASLGTSAAAEAAEGPRPQAHSPVPEAQAAPDGRLRTFEIVFGPFDRKFTAAAVDGIVADLRDFGTLEEIGAAPGPKPRRARGKAKTKAPVERRFRIETGSTEQELADALGFMADPDRVEVIAVEPQPAAPRPVEEQGFGLFVPSQDLRAAQPAEDGSGSKVVELRSPKGPLPQAAEASSIRVSVEKVDQLINLVGELVITQAMLAQTASRFDPVLHEALFNGLAQLERNTRDLQEAAMAIRMMPMSLVFARFPRLVRDTAAKLGKEVELHTVGENTELDKGLIERIVDPLTHLVRNSLDHGLEPPEERAAAGKVRRGTITLHAYHQGGAIVIEVSDDGRGLQREKILAKARERGRAVSDAMTDAEVWQLVFEPGFSTAEQVTDVSGRGVGMDVVRRNIQELGGRVEIESSAGVGTRVTIRLPLTLAILDGMSVRLGREIVIVPLGYITEALQPQPEAVRSLAGRGLVIAVRGEYLPVVALAEVLGLPGEKRRYEEGILLVLEAEGGKTALFVDELLGQHQVVIKSLEANYRKVPGISGATILGDGRVALILDVAHVVARAHSRLELAA